MTYGFTLNMESLEEGAEEEERLGMGKGLEKTRAPPPSQETLVNGLLPGTVPSP